MLLASLIQQQQDNYAQIQVQIELLQEKQREIQANLQKLGSVESKMVAAVQLVHDAIAAIKEICPSELDSYKQTVLVLFGEGVVTQIEPSAEDTKATDVVSEDIAVVPLDIEPASEDITTTTDATDKSSNEDTKAQDVASSENATVASVDLITVDSLLESIKVLLASAPYVSIKNICADYKLSTKGKQTDLRNRFLKYCIDSDFIQLHGIAEYLSNILNGSQMAA